MEGGFNPNPPVPSREALVNRVREFARRPAKPEELSRFLRDLRSHLDGWKAARNGSPIGMIP
ncbi:MAG: hypothetical protein AB1405_08975 [Bdellovibrionota bacterium]